jgi:phosphate transport system substrate-binding protein
MMEALDADPYGIAYAALGYKTAQTRTVPIAETGTQPFVTLTRSTALDRTYPLVRTAYIYFAPDHPDGTPAKLDPKIREFLRYVLSRQGQEDMAQQSIYLPLTVNMVQQQLQKLQ